MTIHDIGHGLGGVFDSFLTSFTNTTLLAQLKLSTISMRKRIFYGFAAAVLIFVTTGCTTIQRGFDDEVVINAPQRIVWDTLVGFDEYDSWNPYFQTVEGELEPGKEIRVVFTRPDGRSDDLYVKVERVVSPTEITWGGGVESISNYRMSIILEYLDIDQTRISIRERFVGAMSPFYDLSNRREAFAQMASALKKYSERRYAASLSETHTLSNLSR